MHRKDHFTSCNPIKTGKHKVNFHCTWPNVNYFCVFHSNEYVNNISVNMLKTNFLTSYMQMTKKNPGHLEFFICLPRWLCRMHLLLNMSHVTCKSYVIANQALQEEHDCHAVPSHQSKFYFHDLKASYWQICAKNGLNLQRGVNI